MFLHCFLVLGSLFVLATQGTAGTTNDIITASPTGAGSNFMADASDRKRKADTSDDKPVQRQKADSDVAGNSPNGISQSGPEAGRKVEGIRNKETLDSSTIEARYKGLYEDVQKSYRLPFTRFTIVPRVLGPSCYILSKNGHAPPNSCYNVDATLIRPTHGYEITGHIFYRYQSTLKTLPWRWLDQTPLSLADLLARDEVGYHDQTYNLMPFVHRDVVELDESLNIEERWAFLIRTEAVPASAYLTKIEIMKLIGKDRAAYRFEFRDGSSDRAVWLYRVGTEFHPEITPYEKIEAYDEV